MIVQDGGMLARLLPEHRFIVNSLHSQGIDRLSPRLRSEAQAPDGTIEAVSMPDAKSFLLAVQWHPEWRAESNPTSLRLFRAFGAACAAGLLAATADVVCFLDADASLDPAQLPRVVDPILTGRADLVLGRRVPTRFRAWPPHARVANALLARRLRQVSGCELRDLGPMRAARRRELLALELTEWRFGYPLQMVTRAVAAGWRIEEVDVAYAPRVGRSKVTGTVTGTIRAARVRQRVR